MEKFVSQEIQFTSRDIVPWGRFVALFPQYAQLLTKITDQDITRIQFQNTPLGFESFNALMRFLTPPDHRSFLQSPLPAVKVVK